MWLFTDPVSPNGEEQGDISIQTKKNHKAGWRSFDRLRTCDPCQVCASMSEGEIVREKSRHRMT